MSKEKKKLNEEKADSSPAKTKTDGAAESGEEEFSFTRFIFDWASYFMTALIIVVIMLTFVFRQATVSGSSMTDTLKSGDRLILSNFMYSPKCGDIIVASHGNNFSQPIVKRVIATGGQSISINYNTYEVSVDGVVLQEDYIKGKTVKLSHPLDIPDVIPEGYVFVMGDNREGSLDSRSTEIGLIPVENIIGKAEIRVYPLNSFGSVYK